jgi:hypothetical protein
MAETLLIKDSPGPTATAVKYAIILAVSRPDIDRQRVEALPRCVP